MGRGVGQVQGSTLLYGPVPKRTDFAALLAERQPKAFYVLFEQQFGQQLAALAKERLQNAYQPPEYDLEIELPVASMPPDASFEELLDEQDDEFLVGCRVLIRDRNGNWGLDVYENFHMSAQELLDLGWHRDGQGLQDRCITYLHDPVAESPDP
jgi:hypothetical protein